MREEQMAQLLDGAVDRVVAGRALGSSGDENVDALARLAAGLRGLPDPQFRAGARANLAASRSPREATAASGASMWLRRRMSKSRSFRAEAPFLVAGSSSGLVAGACCVIGFTGWALGISSAAAVTSFIDRTLPYFIALSIAGLAGWLFWLLRAQGFTLANVGHTLRRHGFAMAASYASVLGASMLLTMAAGLY